MTAIFAKLRVLMSAALFALLLSGVNAYCASADDLRKFEMEAYEFATELLHNHTFDISNVPAADSLYEESVKKGSTLGKLYALRVKYYALVGNGDIDGFMAAVDEFIAISEAAEFYDEYFDAVNAKIQYYLGREEYGKCMELASDMLNAAEKAHSDLGQYESNLLLGQIYKYRENYLVARQYLDRALEYVEPTDSIPHTLIYREIAECETSMTNYDVALEYARKACDWANYDTYRYFSEWTLLNTVFCSHNMPLFRQLYGKSILRDDGGEGIVGEKLVKAVKVMELTSLGRFDEALALCRELEEASDLGGLPVLVYYYQGDYRNAYETLRNTSRRSEQRIAGIHQEELAQMDAKLGNAQLRYEAEMEKGRHRTTMLMVLIAIFVVLMLIAAIWIWQRDRQTKQLIKLQAQTQAALENAEKANAMKVHFIQNMNHEIRTPLNAIYGLTQLLGMDVELDAQSKAAYTEEMGKQTTTLTRMLDDIVTLSNLDSGSVEFKYADVSVPLLLSEVIGASPEKPSEAVKVKVVSDNIHVFTDASKLRMAISMLFNNAVAYTQEGQITLSAELKDSQVSIVVEDSGSGVADDIADKVFDRFFKGDDFKPGTGLGLAVCKSTVNALGGEVHLDRSFRTGARFVVTLPVAPAAKA